MTLSWLARAGLVGVGADMTVLSSTGPDDPLLISGGVGIEDVRIPYEMLLWTGK
jgi:hypothetical protein